jgi:hypothetical protein
MLFVWLSYNADSSAKFSLCTEEYDTDQIIYEGQLVLVAVGNRSQIHKLNCVCLLADNCWLERPMLLTDVKTYIFGLFPIQIKQKDKMGTGIAGQRRNRGSITGRSKRFSSFPHFKVRLWDPSNLLFTGSRGLFLQKKSGRESDNSPPSSVKVNNRWNSSVCFQGVLLN